MVLHHSGDNTTLLEISCEDFIIAFIGSPTNKKSQFINGNMNSPAFLQIHGEYKDKVQIKSITQFEGLAINNGNSMMPCFFEDGIYQILIRDINDGELRFLHMDGDISGNFTRFQDDLIGTIKFNGDVGYSTFKLYSKKMELLSITIEVFPSKMDYINDYKEMMKEINEELSSLAFQLMGNTFHKGTFIDTQKQTNAEFINILKVIFDSLEKALIRIERRPKHNVTTKEEIKTSVKCKISSRKTISYLRKHPEALSESSMGFININSNRYLPTKAVEKIKETTTDIYENRFVKYMVKYIIKRLKAIEGILKSNNKDNENYLSFIQEKRRILEHHLNRNFKNIGDINEKKSMTLVFQMAPGYREVYYRYNLLKKGLSIGDDLYKLTPKKIWKLYEMWCYIALHNILEELGYTVEEHGILRYSSNGLYISLMQNSESMMIYKNANGERIELWYNKAYSSLPTTDQRPDSVLCIKNLSSNDKDNDESNDRIYIFDAKYRLQIENDGSISPVEEDINVMHRYRDSIVSKIPNSHHFKYDTFGAYLMFPYWDQKAFINHKFYKSISSVNIGAFPMLPGSTDLIKAHIKSILTETTLEAKSSRLTIDIDDDYAKFKVENVMVVNVKDKDHLEAYLKHKFYHIPVNKLKNVRTAVEYIAFYQSKNSFGNDAGIRYYGRIHSSYIYKRNECSEILKRSSEEKYLRFTIENIIKVNTIRPVEYGPQLISYTTLYLLKNAENLHELKLRSWDEVKLYKHLKKISSEKGYKLTREKDCYKLNDRKVEICDGKKVKVDGKVVGIKYVDSI